MNVVVLGAGTVGQSIAELLCARGVNVCVVDEQADVLRRVEERFDVQTVCGSAFDVATLFQAGVLTADLCLAVTSRDEVNLLSASVAREMGASRSVAKVRRAYSAGSASAMTDTSFGRRLAPNRIISCRLSHQALREHHGKSLPVGRQ